MDEWEYLRALQLEIEIKNIGLTLTEFSQIRKILEQQFDEDCYTEINGSIFNRRDEKTSYLEFEVIRPPKISEVETALRLFRQGDFSKIGLLADYISQASKTIEKYHGENHDLKTVKIIFEVAAKHPESWERFDEERIQRYFGYYKYFLESYIAASGEDFKVDKQGFLGIFHCHKNGSEPSPMDIQANRKTGIPDVVISAKENYVDLTTLYLIAGGEVKKLYQGPLQPKQ